MPTRAAQVYQQQLRRIRRQSTLQILALWAQANPETFPTEVVPTILAMQRQGVTLTDAYLSLTIGATTGTTTAPAGLDPDAYIGRHARRGVFVEEVYGRPWRQFTNAAQAATGRRVDPSTLVEMFLGRHPAARAATARLEQTIATDLQLAARYAQTARMTADTRVSGYRRVLGPGKNCGLCIAASTRRYHVEDLQPIHPHCNCAVEPVTHDVPAGAQVIDRERLAAVNERIASDDYTRSAYGRLRIDAAQLPTSIPPADLAPVEVIDNHPEIPGLLWPAGHAWQP